MRTTFNIGFVCRPSKVQKSGLAPVEMTIVINGARTYLALPRKEQPSTFKKLSESKKPNDLKDYLQGVYNKVSQRQTEMMLKGVPLTAQALKDFIQYGCSDSYTVGQLFDDYLAILKKRVGNDLSQSVYRKSTQLSKISYKVNSDMVADNYYLFVCDEDEDIDIFIEEKIARNLADATKSLSSSMYCWKQGDTNGTQCIFLIGINNDWSVQVIPIGVISVDNIAPNYGMSKNTFNESYTKLDFSKRGFTIDVSDHPNISGWWDVSYGSFQGWNIPYIISWSGDVSKVIIYGTKSSPKTIELDDKSSPYHISIYTSLIIGDNYIKLEAIDKLGNKSTQEINIATVAVDNDKTHIDIDNNIWN